MGARQHHAAACGQRRVCPQEPSDLCFLAAHDVGDMAVRRKAHARDDPYLQAIGSVGNYRMAIKRVHRHGAAGIRRLAPAMTECADGDWAV